MMDYQSFLNRKLASFHCEGVTATQPHELLFPFQRDIVKWALRRGRACVWADCGLGKTFMQLEWARQIPGDVLIVAPLNVAQQTIREGVKLGCEVRYVRDDSSVKPGITITNYEMLGKLSVGRFKGVVLDESSILKAFDGKTRNLILNQFKTTPFRLACTATPSPNDHMELGNHAEFVGAMTRTEMLSKYFVHDGGDTSKWRLKGHAESEFWKWICSWAVMLRKPSDLGYENNGFVLPPLKMHEHIVQVGPSHGELLPKPAATLNERRSARRSSLTERVELAAKLAVEIGEHERIVFWCGLNDESEAIAKAVGAVEICGSTPLEERERICAGFLDGSIRRITTKPSIWGFGLNLQCCSTTVCVGISDSYEDLYQLIRRFWRFGQTDTVNVHIIISELEGAVLSNIKRKEAIANQMAGEMVKHMHSMNEENLKATSITQDVYREKLATGNKFTLHLGDCVEVVRGIPDESVQFSIVSPPFASLYCYSASDRDMGNSDDNEFKEHFWFLVRELGRVMMAGRLVAVHCFDIPSMKERDGVIGLKDFSNQIRTEFEAEGFIYHSRVTIWKDPVTQMQRTKALGLLHKTIRKDSSMARQGLPDYLIVMRKSGENAEPIGHSHNQSPVDQWQKWASPVWMDINPSDTLQHRSAREEKDERHICPLQLDVIRRSVLLWSNPGDVILSPFAGIGSEGVVAIENNRRFIGVELKESYWSQAEANLRAAETVVNNDMFNNP